MDEIDLTPEGYEPVAAKSLAKRPRTLNEELAIPAETNPLLRSKAQRDSIIAELTRNVSESVACAIAGVHFINYSNALRKGRADTTGRTVAGQFYLAVQRAKALAEMRWTGHLDAQSAKGDTKATIHLLKHLAPATWSEKVNVSTNNEVVPEDLAALSSMSIEDLRKLAETGDLSVLEASPAEDVEFTELEDGEE